MTACCTSYVWLQDFIQSWSCFLMIHTVRGFSSVFMLAGVQNELVILAFDPEILYLNTWKKKGEKNPGQCFILKW